MTNPPEPTWLREIDLALPITAQFVVTGNIHDLHLTGAEAAEVADQAGVELLILTHIPPWHDPETVLAEARGVRDRPIELATPGARWTVGR